LEKLKNKNIDFGGGLERVAVASLGERIFLKIDTFALIRKKMKVCRGKFMEKIQKKQKRFA